MPFSLNGGELMSDNELYKSIKVQEHIDIVDVVKAYTILYHAQVNNTYDIYLFLASINLLNTYVKQNKKAISYSFKSRIFFINELLAHNDFNDVKVNYLYSKKEQLYMFMVFDVQFSFHGIILESGIWDMLKRYQSQFSWDGIRKQMCAKTVFDTILKKKELTALTRDFRNLYDYLDEVVDRFNKGEIKLDKKGLVDNNGVFV